MKFAFRIILLSYLTISSAYAEDSKHDNDFNKQAITELPADIRELLTREMQAIQAGMQAIIPAYASGNWQDIVKIAEKIETSYILKQQLTEKQRHQLHNALPIEFVKLDQQFHYLAGMLAHAASMKKQELVGFYFSELNRACIQCHSEFAQHKFPNFNTKHNNMKHSH